MGSIRDFLINEQQTREAGLVLLCLAILISWSFFRRKLKIRQKTINSIAYTLLSIAIILTVMNAVLTEKYDKLGGVVMGLVFFLISRFINTVLFKYDEAVDRFVEKRNWDK